MIKMLNTSIGKLFLLGQMTARFNNRRWRGRLDSLDFLWLMSQMNSNDRWNLSTLVDFHWFNWSELTVLVLSTENDRWIAYPARRAVGITSFFFYALLLLALVVGCGGVVDNAVAVGCGAAAGSGSWMRLIWDLELYGGHLNFGSKIRFCNYVELGTIIPNST